MQEFFIDSDGIAIHAKLEMPKGAPERCPLCIVQHGLTGHMEEEHILAVSAALRETGVATLRVEMYGHGKSGGSFGRHTLLKWVDNMLDVIDYAKALPFVTDLYLCGHSQGGNHHEEPAQPAALQAVDEQADHHGDHQDPGDRRSHGRAPAAELLFLVADYVLLFRCQMILDLIFTDPCKLFRAFFALGQVLVHQDPALVGAHFVRVQRQKIPDHIAVSFHPFSSFPEVSAGPDDR